MAYRRNYVQSSKLPTVVQAPATGMRRTRYPKHNFYVEFDPFDIQPIAIVPVSAGDSIKHLRYEARVLTNPILNQIAGWWAEFYWCYVRFSDLEEYAAAQAMVSDPSFNLTGLVTAAKTWTYHNGNGPDWTFMAYKQIVRTHFRPENGDWNDATGASGAAKAGLVGRTWVDTVELEANLPNPNAADNYAGRWEHYEALRRAKLVTMDYPEWLRSQGIDVPQQLAEPLSEKRRPELIRFTRQFAYPSNTVNPDGSGTVSAVSWVVSDRMDRAIFCDEPGFVVGVALVRPKLYRSGQVATGAALLRDARTIAPDILEEAPQETLKMITGTNQASITTAVDYWFDTEGVYVLGDQFIVGSAPEAALPNATTLQKSYPVTADIEDLFVNDAKKVYVDGSAALSIVGRRQLGTSPQAFTD
nr:MAG: major capsid protein [Microvirus sp.]